MKVTYLFGAGASKEALPIVNEIPSRIEEIIEILEKDEFKLPNNAFYDILDIKKSKLQIQNELIQDIKWLLDKSKNHASIDTFAKKLRITKKYDELKRLKISFSVFLILEQTRKKADKRYDSFFASLLTENYINFPKNVRIISWNYDFQFEKAFIEYSEENNLSRNQSILNVLTKFTNDDFENSKFSIIKLNGSSNIIDPKWRRQYYFFNEFNDKISVEFIDEILSHFAYLRYKITDHHSGLSFAWEGNINDKNGVINISKNETFDTEILIVIGYSFPYFNREIDREIIGNMVNLKKVYFQDPFADNIKERFLSIIPSFKPENLISRFDVGQFLLPNEL